MHSSHVHIMSDKEETGKPKQSGSHFTAQDFYGQHSLDGIVKSCEARNNQQSQIHWYWLSNVILITLLPRENSTGLKLFSLSRIFGKPLKNILESCGKWVLTSCEENILNSKNKAFKRYKLNIFQRIIIEGCELEFFLRKFAIKVWVIFLFMKMNM